MPGIAYDHILMLARDGTLVQDGPKILFEQTCELAKRSEAIERQPPHVAASVLL